MKSKYYLAGIALAFIALSFILKKTDDVEIKFDFDENIIISPDLYIQTENSPLLHINAKSSEKYNHDIRMLDVKLDIDDKLHLQSGLCVFDIERDTIVASEDVHLKFGETIELRTSEVDMNIKHKMLYAKSAVEVTFDNYSVIAKSAEVDLNTMKITMDKPMISNG